MVWAVFTLRDDLLKVDDDITGEDRFFLSRFKKTTIYNVILHCAIHSEKRYKVTESSLWMALQSN